MSGLGQENQGYYGSTVTAQPGFGQPVAPVPVTYSNAEYSNTGPVQPGYIQNPGPGAPGAVPGPPPGPPPPAPQAQWMQKPQPVMGCPPGLEYLTQLDQLLVEQKVELLQEFTGWETKNKYEVKNSLGQQVFYAAEESDACMRQCCGSERGFVIHITDNFGNEVMRVIRPFKCCAGCECLAALDCCAFELEVQAPVGVTVGYVRQTFSWMAPKYDLLDASRQPILRVKGPICICQAVCCQRDENFFITSAQTGTEVGKVSKQWSGLAKEIFTNADNFGVNFPADLDVRMKAVCLASVFLIDFMFFEDDDNNDN